jgi:alanyl-tRNA synthetase
MSYGGSSAALCSGDRVGLQAPYLAQLSDVVIEQMKDGFQARGAPRRNPPHPHRRGRRFGKTLERGLRLFEEICRGRHHLRRGRVPLHDTYGFPLELTRELAHEQDSVSTKRVHAADGATADTLAWSVSNDKRAAEFATRAGFAGFVGYEKIDVLTQIGASRKR